jgi:hypothetical protein
VVTYSIKNHKKWPRWCGFIHYVKQRFFKHNLIFIDTIPLNAYIKSKIDDFKFLLCTL